MNKAQLFSHEVHKVLVVMHMDVAKAACFLLHVCYKMVSFYNNKQYKRALFCYLPGCFLKDAKKKGKMG